MARKPWGRFSQSTLAVLLALSSFLGLAGCAARGARRVEAPTAERREASREQLLTMLEQQTGRLETLSATTRVSIFQQDVVVPATLADDVARMRGKPYQKKFLQVEVNGLLYFSRRPEGGRNIRFSGEVVGPTTGFMFLGKDSSFWMLLPTSEEERSQLTAQGKAAPRGKVLVGKLDPRDIRPKGTFSMRPQDFSDLLLFGEVSAALQGADICYIEKWPDYYVMNFLRPDWPEHIYKKAWIERQGLTVAVHQLFDGAGEVVAEARFRDYANYTAKGSKVSAKLPSEMEILWPRDKVVLRATLSNVKVNGEIPAKLFDEKLLEGYPTETLEMPAAPAR